MAVNQGYVLAEQYWSEPWKESQVVRKSCARDQYRERDVVHLETWNQPADANARGWVRMSDDNNLVIVSAFKITPEVYRPCVRVAANSTITCRYGFPPLRHLGERNHTPFCSTIISTAPEARNAYTRYVLAHGEGEDQGVWNKAGTHETRNFINFKETYGVHALLVWHRPK